LLDFLKKMSKTFGQNKLGIWYLLAYAVLIVAIIGPIFLSSGLVFSTDLTLGEYYKYYFSAGENLQLLRPIFFLWAKFLPMHILQKVIFLSVFGLLYYGGQKLFFLFSTKKVVVFSAIVFLVFNPFFYERFVEGALNVYFSYAFYPIFFYAVIEVFENLTAKATVKLVFISILICGISTYNIILILPIIFIFAVVKKEDKKRTFIVAFIVMFLIILTNLYWIFPTWQESNTQGQMVFSGFSQQDFQTFGPVALDPLDINLTVLTLNGHWAEKFHRFPSVMAANKYWLVVAGLIGVVLSVGIVKSFCKKNKDREVLAFLAIGAIFYFLSLGVNSIFSKKITIFLLDNVSFYRGMRETSKFLTAMPVVYGIFLAIGLEQIIGGFNKYFNQSGKIIQNLLCGFFMFLIIFSTQPLIGVIDNQLRPVHYPSDWYALRDFLNQEIRKSENKSCQFKEEGKIKKCYPVLNLPWHYYQYFNFTNRTIINPIPLFFKFNVLSADNTEIGKIESHSIRSESKIAEKLIKKIKNGESLSAGWEEDFKSMGVQYIIIVKEEDWKIYNNFFSRESNLKNVFDSKNFAVYEII